MKLPGRLQAAIDVLSEIQERHRPASQALADWGKSHRFAGSGDRAAIGNLVYDALRQRASIAWRMNGETPRALALGALAFGWGETALSLGNRGAKRGFVNDLDGVMRIALAKHTAFDCPRVAGRPGPP